MDYFDKRMALEVIEDVLTGMFTPEDHGYAVGLCSAFYMSGVLDEPEWRALLQRIPEAMADSCRRCVKRHGGRGALH